MRGARPNLRLFSSYFDRTDVETVIHSDNGFAAVSYLRIKGVALEEKPESWNDLAIPSQLEADFARIQALLLDHHSVDASTHAACEPPAHQPTTQPRGPSHSRRGDWVAVGNVCSWAGQAITFEEEVTQCFRDLQGSTAFIEEVLL